MSELLITGGVATGSIRATDENWVEVLITPNEGASSITVSLPASAVQDSGGRGNAASATFHIPESPSPASQLTARFVNVPVAHMMDNFTVELHFSENIPGLSYLTMKDHAFETTSGEIGGARRIEKGKNQKWLITVSPQGPEDVSITLRPSPDCQSEHAICSASDESLASAVQTTVRGPATLSVASARAHESDDETIDFVVSLDRNALKTITVDYATRDGSAKAGEDYTATSGTLTFTVGQRSKTVQVPLLDDAKDEGEETFELILSNASGALLGNTTATGTIENDDPLQRAWLARFGRTVGSQAVDAIGERVTGDAPTHVTIAGQSLGAAPDGDALAEIEANARAEAMARWLRGEDAEDAPSRAHRSRVPARERVLVERRRRAGRAALGRVGAGRDRTLRRAGGRRDLERRGDERVPRRRCGIGALARGRGAGALRGRRSVHARRRSGLEPQGGHRRKRTLGGLPLSAPFGDGASRPLGDGRLRLGKALSR